MFCVHKVFIALFVEYPLCFLLCHNLHLHMRKTCSIGKTVLSVSCARFKSHICKLRPPPPHFKTKKSRICPCLSRRRRSTQISRLCHFLLVGRRSERLCRRLVRITTRVVFPDPPLLTPDEGPSLETSMFPLSFQVVREPLPFAYPLLYPVPRQKGYPVPRQKGYPVLKARLHGAIFHATCIAILLLADVKLANTCFHHSLLIYS